MTYKGCELPPVFFLVVVLEALHHVAITCILRAPDECAPSLILQVLNAIRKCALEEDILLDEKDCEAGDATYARGLFSEIGAPLLVVLQAYIGVVIVNLLVLVLVAVALQRRDRQIIVDMMGMGLT